MKLKMKIKIYVPEVFGEVWTEEEVWMSSEDVPKFVISLRELNEENKPDYE